ncbi:MAG: histidine phosphatase family protein [Moraxellaceae bacterium]|nr:MAG: histidine phosphatase family protein [Moraxellaceae bacterium]
MFEAIDLLPTSSQPLVLLTRHSIREAADNNGFASYQLPLTPIGRHLAFEWGKWLSVNTDLQLAACISSPIPRCVDTAIEMLKGAHASQILVDTPQQLETSLLNIDQHNLLVEPGSFVVDIAQAGPHFKQHGALKFINQFLSHQLPGMKIPVQGAQDILRLLFDNLPRQDNHLLLAVSHDTILAALFAVMAGHTRIERKDWPNMMEGAFLWFEGDSFERSLVNWIWRGQHYRFKPYSFKA